MVSCLKGGFRTGTFVAHQMQNTYHKDNRGLVMGVATCDQLHDENTAFADSYCLNFLGTGGNGIL